METLNNILSIAEVALGLGFVIFLHELGHFALAKWNGVKVEKFSIGFGPTVLGFTRGETEYVLALIPLGGFVKMLGEGPDEEANKSSDPRAYPNKTVWARMAIITAGVVMNLILGLACFVYAYKMGMDETPTKIGAVISGSPAYLAGIRAGDEIVAMDGRGDLSFNNLKMRVSLSGQGQLINFSVARPGVLEPISYEIEPRRDGKADMPGIGIYPSFGLTLSKKPFHAPAGLAAAPSPPDAGLQAGDKVVSVGPVGGTQEAVDDVLAYYRAIARYIDKPAELGIERPAPVVKGQAPSTTRVTTTLPANRFVDFGLRLKAEPISAVRNGSLADAAGFRKGDILVKINGRADFDPMRLPSLCLDSAGKPMTFEIERPEPGGDSKVLTLTVTPDDTPPWFEVAHWEDEALDVPGLGMAYPVRTKVEGVRPGSPAEKAGIKTGDVISSVEIPSPPWGSGKSVVVNFNDASPFWPYAFQNIQLLPLAPIAFRVNNSTTKLSITPEPDPTWYHTLRGEQFEFLNRRTPPMTVATALRRGADDTLENILSIYAMVRSMVLGRVSPKGLGGPLMIGDVAFRAAKLGLTELVHFLGILSINLAVLNFLPVPPLDGGQMVFLLAEKIRGRPLPDSALIGGTYLGLLMVLALMSFVLFQDFVRYVMG